MTISFLQHDYYYFNADINDPLVMLNIKLRLGECRKSGIAEKSALKYVKEVVECFDGQAYLLTVSPEVGKSSLLRTKKGVLWKAKKLQSFKRLNFEIDVGVGTRIASLVDLKEFDYDISESLILNWMYSLIIITEYDLEFLSEYVKQWIEVKTNKILPFDYSIIAQDLLTLRTASILRYFPTDNNRNESLILVGNREHLNIDLVNSIDNL